MEKERGSMFILLALCFLSLRAPSVGDCWQGLWSKLHFLVEHILCSSLRSLKHKHTSQYLQSTLKYSFLFLLIQSFCSWFFMLRLFRCHIVLFKHHSESGCVSKLESFFFYCWRHVRLVMQYSYAALSIRPCWFFSTCMVKLHKKATFSFASY